MTMTAMTAMVRMMMMVTIMRIVRMMRGGGGFQLGLVTGWVCAERRVGNAKCRGPGK